MTSRNISAWIPIPIDSELAGTEVQQSVVVAIGRRKPMNSSTLEVDRLLGSTVNGGTSLTEGTTDGSKITMYSYLFNGKDSIDEDDAEDSAQDPFSAYSYEWRSQLNVVFDNSAIGITGARSSTESDHRPYTSIYRAVRTNDTEAGYTADTNFGSGAASYTNLSATLGKLEQGRYFNSASIAVVAHPSVRQSLRGLVDDNHRPIFVEAGGNVMQDTLFGMPLKWSLGAMASTNFDMTTVGGALVVFVNTRYFVYGPRIEPQSRIIPAGMNATELTYVMQHRARMGAVLTVPQAASVFEITS